MTEALSNASWDPNKPDERLDIVGFKNPVDVGCNGIFTGRRYADVN